MPRKAASTAALGLPTKVTTVRFVLAPGSTSSRETPSADSIAAVICRMISSCRPIRVEQAHNVFYQERQTFLHDSPHHCIIHGVIAVNDSVAKVYDAP